MPHDEFNLAAAARQEMTDHGFQPDFPAAALQQLAAIHPRPDHSLRDLTALDWSSIDNDDSRDLDQIEWAERVEHGNNAGGIRVLVGVADVDSAVAKDTPLDRHAAREATTVYAAVRTFPMLPEQLSTDLTSLNENQDRAAVVMEFTVAADGSVGAHSVYRAMVRNHAQLTYNAVGAWLEGTAAAPPKVAASADLQAQLKLQDEAAGALREARYRLGALSAASGRCRNAGPAWWSWPTSAARRFRRSPIRGRSMPSCCAASRPIRCIIRIFRCRF
jgi:exoribonuclease-2